MEQKIITPENDYRGLNAWLRDHQIKRLLLVCGDYMRYLPKLSEHLRDLEEQGLQITRFVDFQPNPQYQNVVDGIEAFNGNQCDAIMAIGGGSAMDVAKCIKLFCRMDAGRNYLEQAIVPNGIPFLAMPTTAGSGSEATRYSVIYYQGKKQSVTHESCIPGTVLLDPDALRSLPIYQKKSTMLDALCHAIESWWSVNSTDESKAYAAEAIRGVMAHRQAYLDNEVSGLTGMLKAANAAGKAINITQTTAGHAMCYKITGLFGCAHGHAAALCVRRLFPWMLTHMDQCIDPRGAEYLRQTMREIAQALDCGTAQEAAEGFAAFFDSLQLDVPAAAPEQYEELKTSVNPVRLKNHPVALSEDDIDTLYHMILKENV